MSWVKTSDQAEAYQLELTVDEITGIKSIKDENRFTLLEIAHQRKNQSMLNYFYSIALDSLQQQFGEGFDKNLDPQTDDRLQHLLYWAIQCRQLDTVMLILNKYSHIIRLDNILNNGLTPLQMAADLNYNDLVETLLNRGSAIDSIVPGYFYHAGKTALHIAADHGHDEVVQILLHHKANVNPNDGSRRTPLSSAVDNGHHKIVKVLLDHGANVNVMDRYGNRRTPLSSAVDNDHNEIAKALLDHGADVNVMDRFGNTALHKAVLRKNLDLVQTLIRYGADVNTTNEDGKTPLIDAIYKGCNDIVKTLLSHGANMNTDSIRNSPLALAALKGHSNIVITLLAEGININFSIGELHSKAAHYKLPPIKQHIINMLNEALLLDYLKKAGQRHDQAKKKYNFFDDKLTLTLPGGYTAKEKNDAANALKNVVFDGADPSQLAAHMGPLSEGRLGSLYKALKKPEWSIAPRMGVSATKKQK